MRKAAKGKCMRDNAPFPGLTWKQSPNRFFKMSGPVGSQENKTEPKVQEDLGPSYVLTSGFV